MPQGDPRPGEKYLHFKRKPYQIVAVARHSETDEKLVVYQALYGEFGIFARPFDMFISEVDRDKYPQVRQKYRFQYLEDGKIPEETEEEEWEGTVSEEAESGSVSDMLLKFLDAETFAEKYDIVERMRGELNDKMIDDLAVAIDVVIPEGRLDERYRQLKHCIQTRIKYERR